MFRLVTKNIEPGGSAVFWLVCDIRACSCQQLAPLGTADLSGVAPEQLNAAQGKFLAAAGQTGWLIGLDAQFCPACHREMADQNKMERKLVQVASSMPNLPANLVLVNGKKPGG